MKKFLSSIFMLIMFSVSIPALSYDVETNKQFSDEKEDTQFEKFEIVKDFEITERWETDEVDVKLDNNERLQKLFDEAEAEFEPVFTIFKNHIDKRLQKIHNTYKYTLHKSSDNKPNTKIQYQIIHYKSPDVDLTSFLLNIKNRN